ncbi:MAG: serine--tRNA ligase, partial [Paracoccaceae bacterium]|nr:serine--tRNA ligase [Paracoccaceae bacterium]
MHDIRAIRDNPADFDAALKKRGLPPMAADILSLDEARRGKIRASETAQAAQNAASKEVGAAKAAGNDAEFDRLRALVADKKSEIAKLTEEAAAEDIKLRDLLMGIPNLPHPDVPEGVDEKDNVEIRRHGTPSSFDFKPV